MIHLRVLAGKNAGEEIKTHRGALTVGRGAECHLCVPDTKVSHLHGEFVSAGARFVYRDFLSRNGSVLRRGEESVWLGPLNPEWEVRAGDELVIGDATIRVLALKAEDAVLGDAPDLTFAAERTGVSSAHSAELVRFRKFLHFRSYDPTSIREARMMLCEAFRETFPQADCVTLVSTKVRRDGPLQREDLDVGSIVSRFRKPAHASASPFSFHVLAEAAHRGGAVLFSTRPDRHFPAAESIRAARMGSCMCAPLWQGEAVGGFVHLHTFQGDHQPFTRADAQLLTLLAGVASVVIQSATASEERMVTRTLASLGQIVGALAHDAAAILHTLGMNIAGVEQDFPAVTRSDAWKSLCSDLDFLSFFTRDTMHQIRAAKHAANAPLTLRAAPVGPVVTECLDRCRRYFLNVNEAARIELVNTCPPRHKAIFDPMALTQILVNCVKNALDVLKARRRAGRVVVCCSEPPNESFLRLHVCDDAGGIVGEVLDRLGTQMVSTKGENGAGLGTMIILDLMRRMDGHVLIASSTKDKAECPAGTIVSLCLPKPADHAAAHPRDGQPPMKLIADYHRYRSRLRTACDPSIQL